MRLEFLHATLLNKNNEPWFTDVDFTVANGEMACVCNGDPDVLEHLLAVVLGYQKLSKGYVSVNGEWLNPQSAVAYRQLMAFLPTHLQQLPYDSVWQMLESPFTLACNKTKFDRDLFAAELNSKGIDTQWLGEKPEKVGEPMLQYALATALLQLRKPIVLLSQPDLSENSKMWQVIKQLRQEDSLLLCTTVAPPSNCDKIIEI